MAGQGASGAVLGVRTSVGGLLVAAIGKHPVAPQLWTAWRCRESVKDVLPADPAMLLHVGVSDAVRHSLVAECVDQPIEYRRRIMSLDRCNDSMSGQANSAIIDEPSRTRDLADAAEQLDRSVNA